MGNSDRDAATDLKLIGDNAVVLPEEVRTYNFYQLVELLHKLHGINPEQEVWERQCNLVFSANPSLGFSPSDVANLAFVTPDKLVMQTNFFGLSGAQSPLPGFFVEQIANEEAGGCKQSFIDFFNNRLIGLVYRIWRKYRYHVRFKSDAQDPFSAQIFSLVGLGDPYLRGDTPINWCKMLAYAGTLAGRSRSPQVVAGIISHCFDLDKVEIKQWIKRKVNIAASQQMALGEQNARLGEDCTIGESIVCCKGKFIISISGLSRERFSDFLPSGKEFGPLCTLVEFILREQMAYDLEICMQDEEAMQMSFTGGVFPALGWTSFLGPKIKNRQVLIQVRQ